MGHYKKTACSPISSWQVFWASKSSNSLSQIDQGFVGNQLYTMLGIFAAFKFGPVKFGEGKDIADKVQLASFSWQMIAVCGIKL